MFGRLCSSSTRTPPPTASKSLDLQGAEAVLSAKGLPGLSKLGPGGMALHLASSKGRNF